jgi:hypothetical protein
MFRSTDRSLCQKKRLCKVEGGARQVKEGGLRSSVCAEGVLGGAEVYWGVQPVQRSQYYERIAIEEIRR